MKKAIALSLLLPGCVSLSSYQKKEAELKDVRAQRASCETSLKTLQEDLEVKTDRLRKFNQVDENGTIRWVK